MLDIFDQAHDICPENVREDANGVSIARVANGEDVNLCNSNALAIFLVCLTDALPPAFDWSILD